MLKVGVAGGSRERCTMPLPGGQVVESKGDRAIGFADTAPRLLDSFVVQSIELSTDFLPYPMICRS